MAKLDLTKLYNELSDLTTKEEKFTPTGSIILDTIISDGRGLPEGAFVEIASESGCGKSTCCLHIARYFCSQGKRVIYIDTESGLNQSQVECFGLSQYVGEENGHLFVPVRMQTFGEVDSFLTQVLEDKTVNLIVFDSITACVPTKMTEKNIEEITEPALAARAQSYFMQKFKAKFKNTNKTIIFVNQLRTKLAMGYGQVTKLAQAGGQALGYYMDIRLMMKKAKTLEQSVQGYDKPVPFGVDNLIWTDKNRYARPFLKKTITIHFGKGIANSGAIRQLLEYHKVIEYINRKGWKVLYENEEVMVPKDEIDNFIKDHIDYFKELSNSLGGIKLVPEDCIEDESEVVVTDSESEE